MADVEPLVDGAGVAVVDQADELRPRSGADDPAAAAEISLFGFNVPELDLNCAVHHRRDPVLGLVSGGVVLIRGEAGNAAFADYIDYRDSMPMPSTGLGAVTYPSGVRIRVVEPLERLELSYAAPDDRLRFELAQEALMPAAGEPGGGSFTQAMQSRGELVLDGELIEIDCYFTRERRWSPTRIEEDCPGPPLARAGAVFGPDLALHFRAHDGEHLDSEKLRWGYVWRDGETRPLEAAWMRTSRGGDGAAPTGVEVRLLDARGETYEMVGETRARAPINVWPDRLDQICLMRYRLDGRHCHGDFRDLQSNSFLRSTRV